MTSRERLLTVLNGGIPDRVPVSPFVQETYLAYFFQMIGPDRLLEGKKCADALDFDLMARINRYEIPFFATRSAANWEVSTEDSVSNGILRRTFTIRTPGGTLTQVEAGPYEPDKLTGIHFATTEYLIKNSDDFEIFRKYVPHVSAEYGNEIIEYSRFARRYIEQRGVTVPWCSGGAYNLASRYINVQDMMVDALADEDYYGEYMDLFTDLILEQLEYMARSEFDAIGLQGNIANGGVMGEGFFRDNVMPYEQKILRYLKDAGYPTVYHNCGKAVKLYPCYRDMDLTVWETVAIPPQGDNDLAEAKAFFGDGLILCGTLDQVHFLKTATPEQAAEAAARAVQTGKPGGHYIFACSDYLEDGTPLENVKAMIAAAKEAGVY